MTESEHKYECMFGLTLIHDSKAKGPYCFCCGESDIRFHNVDHKKRRTKQDDLSGERLYRYVIENNYPPHFQVLCFNCNYGKRLFGKCPHKLSENNGQ